MPRTEPASAAALGTNPGDRNAAVDFETLFDEAFPPLFRYCTRLVGDADVAEDVAQEAFVRLLDRQVTGTPAGLRVWLFKVATHIVRDRYRVNENRRRLLEKNPVLPGGTPDPEGELLRGEVVAEVRAALATLDPRDRELLLMREEGFRYQEIAEAVGVKASSIGTLVSRAQRRFMAAYGAAEDQAGEERGWTDHG
jgi:RNA polymerase sigma-70 factor (ECF subfamily)